ncbi:MAG: ribosome maturation factor RimM [Nodosilinea sp.]
MAPPEWIEIGRIVAPQGLKGELRVYPVTDFPERFLTPGRRWVQRSATALPEPVELLRGRLIEGKGLYVVQLDGVTSREGAEALRNVTMMVPATDRPSLEPGEFYVADLVGLRVVLQATGHEIGRVTDIYEAGNDLLEITLTPTDGATSPPPKVLVPFVEAIVPVVDLVQGYIEIDPPAGLLAT